MPWPLLAAALNTLVAAGAEAAAGSVYGYEMLLVARVQLDPLSHAVPGVDCTVVEFVASVTPPPASNVVDVAVMLQPAPEPVASLTSSACCAVTVWLLPLSVAVKLTLHDHRWATWGVVAKALVKMCRAASPLGAVGRQQVRFGAAR